MDFGQDCARVMCGWCENAISWLHWAHEFWGLVGFGAGSCAIFQGWREDLGLRVWRLSAACGFRGEG